MEIWSIFPKEGGDVNFLMKSLADMKKYIRREVKYIMFTEAWIGRWDLLATEVYGDPYLWWVIPVVNDIIDLFDPELVGAILKVPHAYDVWDFLNGVQ